MILRFSSAFFLSARAFLYAAHFSKRSTDSRTATVFASLDDIDLLVTDVELPPALIDQLTATETEVLVA